MSQGNKELAEESSAEDSKGNGDADVDATQSRPSSDDDDAASMEELRANLNQLSEKCELLTQERDEWMQKYDRVMSVARLYKADLENAVKDHKREVADVMKRQPAILVGKLIPTLNMFDVTISSVTDENVKQGITMVQKSLVDALGLSVISPNLGDKFDSEEHMAVTQTESEYPAGSVAAVLGSGYKLDGRVLHPANVSIAKECNEGVKE